MKILEAEQLSLSYGGRQLKEVVREASLSIEAGEIVSIIGPNGSGKSTLLKGLCRLLRPTAGQSLLKGQDIWQLAPKEVAKELAILPQMKSSPSDLTVTQLVSFGRYPHKRYGSGLTEKDQEFIRKAIAKTGLNGYEGRYISSLSGGEQQRVWLAVALAQDPEILILDEPTTYLDIACQLAFMENIRQLNQEDGLTVVMVLHDLNQALRYSDRTCAIKDGRILAFAESDQVITPDLIRELYAIEGELVDWQAGETPFFIPRKTSGTPA
ncbi:MAG: ABC transporter ATP-binding protein [Eubacteriales bacterium]|nr:ABC transporter ATP-binding protein [Eubacteriales bacterium]